MNTSAQRRLGLGPIGDTLFIALVVIDFVFALTLPSGLLGLGGVAILALASLAYLLIGVYGWKYWERSRTNRTALIYFTIQIALGAFIIYWGYGNAWLLLLPLASQSIELPRRGTLVVGLLLVLTIALPAWVPGRLLASGLVKPEDIFSTGAWASLEFAMAVLFVLLFSELVVRERQARTELGEAHRRLGEYAVQVEDLTIVQERNRLAREIHDSLGHHLTAIHIHLEAARALIDSQPAAAADALMRAQSLTQEGLNDVRGSVAALRASPLEDRPLPEALAALVEECRQTGMDADLLICGSPRPLRPPLKLALFRAAQEGLTNVRKHAQARRAAVRLEYDRDGAIVRLTVHDDGVGAAHADGGFGLIGVRERIRLLGGQVRIRTAPAQGFTLEVEAPE